MLAAFKEYVFPYIVYFMVFGVSLYAISRRALTGLILFIVLVSFPQFWYPTHEFPLGSQSLTILFVSTALGGLLQKADGIPLPARTSLIILYSLVSAVGVAIVAQKFSVDLFRSDGISLLADFKNFIMMLFLYFVGYYAVRTEADIKRVVLIMLGVVVVLSWREIANFVVGDSFSYHRRSVGPFWMLGMGANHFAALLVYTSSIAVGLFVVDNNFWRRRFYLATFFVSLYPVFYSYSRGAYVALLFALTIIGGIRYRRLLFVLSVFLLFWDSILPDSVVERIGMTESEDGMIDASAAGRLVVWDLAKQLFFENPVLGIGFHGFIFASEGLQLRNPHNYFLQTAAEHGALGSIFLALIFIKALHSGWILYRRAGAGFLSGLGLGFIASVCALLISNLFGDRFSQLEMGSFFWILFGVVDRAAQDPVIASSSDLIQATVSSSQTVQILD